MLLYYGLSKNAVFSLDTQPGT